MAVSSIQTINVKCYGNKTQNPCSLYNIFSTYAKAEKSLSKRISCLSLFFACFYYIRVLGVRLSLIQVKQSTDLTSAFHGRGGAAEPLGIRPAFPFQDSELFFRRITVALSFYLHPPTHIPFIFFSHFPSHSLPATIIFYFISPFVFPFSLRLSLA